MTHILKLTKDDPVIHLKAYGGVKILGVEQTEVRCEIDAPQLATLVEEDGHVYITANSSCQLTVPVASSIEIEQGMGSVSIQNIQNQVLIEKVLGNLVLSDLVSAKVEKVGGNFSVRNASGDIHVEKISANLVVDDVGSFHCEKVGGSCTVKDVHGDFYLAKSGGKFLAQGIAGFTTVERVGGNFVARDLRLEGDVKAGGRINLSNFSFDDNLELRAGGEIDLAIGEEFTGATFNLHSGAHEIKIKVRDDDLEIGDKAYEYQLGEEKRRLYAAAGSSISLREVSEPEKDIVGDISSHFAYEESAFSELIQERVESATRLAEAKMKAAEFRLEQIRERVEKHRGFNIDLGFDDEGERISPPGAPVPPVNRPIGKKGASDEERLMILQMLQDKKISVDEAETLFKALED